MIFLGDILATWDGFLVHDILGVLKTDELGLDTYFLAAIFFPWQNFGISSTDRTYSTKFHYWSLYFSV